MLSTLFYDDLEADTVLNIPLPGEVQAMMLSQQGHAPPGKEAVRWSSSEDSETVSSKPLVHHSVTSLPDSLERESSAVLHGTLDVSELDTALLWWVSSRGTMHLFAVNKKAAAVASHSSQCRLLPIQLPVRSAAELLTCGICRQSYGGHSFAVSWITRSFHSGMVCLTLQRDSMGVSRAANKSASAAVSRAAVGQMALHLDRERCLMDVSLESVGRTLLEQGGRTVSAMKLEAPQLQTTMAGEESCVSACVLGAVPANAQNVGAVFLASNGSHVWRVFLFADGSVTQEPVRLGTPEDSHPTSALPQEGLLQLMDELDVLQCPPVMHATGLREVLCQRYGEAALEDVLQRMADEGGFSTDASCTAASWWSGLLTGRSGPRDSPANRSRAGEASLGRRYLALSAVQDSAGWFALLRWDGLLSFYQGAVPEGAALPLVPDVPSCRVPLPPLCCSPEESCSFTQWSRLCKDDGQLDVVTRVRRNSFVTEKEQRVLWNSCAVKGQETGMLERVVAMRNCIEVSAPLPMAVLLGCTTAKGTESSSITRRLTLLWGRPLDTDITAPSSSDSASLLWHRRSIAALLQSAVPALARRQQSLLQTVEAHENPSSSATERTPVGSQTYFADGAALRALHTQEDTTVVVEEYLDYHRLHAVESAGESTVEALMEGVTLQPLADIDAYYDLELERRLPAKGLRSLHFTPCDEPAFCVADFMEEDSFTASPLDVFFVTLEALERHPHGAGVLLHLLRGILERHTSLSAITTTAGGLLPALELDATLAQRYITPQSVEQGLELALQPVTSTTTTTSERRCFFHFSRYYMYHCVSRSLLHRLSFVACLYLGWSSSGLSPLHSSNADRTSAQLLRALEYLTAAFFAVQVAGPDLVTFGARMAPALLLQQQQESRTPPNFFSSSLDFRDVVLHTFLSPDILSDAPEPLLQRCVQIAVGLYGGGVNGGVRGSAVPRCLRACEIWTQHLSERVPLLQHLQLLQDLEAGRTTRTAESLMPHCWRVMEGLAALPSPERMSDVLLTNGFLLTDATGSSSFSAIHLTELQELLLRYPEVAPKLYAVGVLRRVVVPHGSRVQLLCSSSAVSTFFLSELLLVMQCVDVEEERHSVAHPSVQFPTLHAGLLELHVDTLLALAQSSLLDGELPHAFHHMENAVRRLTAAGIPETVILQRGTHMSSTEGRNSAVSSPVTKSSFTSALQSYGPLLQRCDGLINLVAQAMRRVCRSSPLYLATLQGMPSCSPMLEECVVQRWVEEILGFGACNAPCQCVSRTLDGGSAAAQNCPACVRLQQRETALYGLHRYLFQRHAYGQCGRVLTNLASALRCAPWGLSQVVLVARLTAMALHAVELINPDVHGPRSMDRSVGDIAATLLEGGSTPSAAMSPKDLPFLRVRAMQGQCEAQLVGLGGSVEAIDLWVDGAPRESVWHAAHRLMLALGECGAWAEAFRFAVLLQEWLPRETHATPPTSPCWVLERWAVYLVQQTAAVAPNDASVEGRRGFAVREVEEQWDRFLLACAECSRLSNQFAGYHAGLTAALWTSYAHTPARVLEAYRYTDSYSAIKSLLQVYARYQWRIAALQTGTAGGAAQLHDEESDEGLEEEPSPLEQRKALVERLQLESCMVCLDAAHIVCENVQHGECFTAGVVDGLTQALEKLNTECPHLFSAADTDGIYKKYTAQLYQVLAQHSIP